MKTSFHCPVCGSDKQVAGNKVCDSKQRWWSRCSAGESAHGDYITDRGEPRRPFPHPLYFTADGLVAVHNGVVELRYYVEEPA